MFVLALAVSACKPVPQAELDVVLSSSSATFDPRTEPANAPTSKTRAVELARSLVARAPSGMEVRYGRLRSPMLNVDADAWLVILDGTAPAVQNPGSEPPTGRPKTYVFVDAVTGRSLLLVGIGAAAL